MDLPIYRALEEAELNSGDYDQTAIAFVGQPELFAVELDGDAGAADGD